MIERCQVRLEFLRGGARPRLMRGEKILRLPPVRVAKHFADLSTGKLAAAVAFDSQTLQCGLGQIIPRTAQDRRGTIRKFESDRHGGNLAAIGMHSKGEDGTELRNRRNLTPQQPTDTESYSFHSPIDGWILRRRSFSPGVSLLLSMREAMAAASRERPLASAMAAMTAW